MDNYSQVYKYTLLQEKRLAKEEQAKEFNKLFYETVKHCIFKEIGLTEMKTWGG
jgi:hypothetical protein